MLAGRASHCEALHSETALHTVSDVVVWGVDCHSVDAHVVAALHLRSREPVGERFSHSLALHTVWSWHTRSDVAVLLAVSHWTSRHVVSAVHWRSLCEAAGRPQASGRKMPGLAKGARSRFLVRPGPFS